MADDIFEQEARRFRTSIEDIQRIIAEVQTGTRPLNDLDLAADRLAKLLDEGTLAFLERGGIKTARQEVLSLSASLRSAAQQRLAPVAKELETALRETRELRRQAQEAWEDSTPSLWQRMLQLNPLTVTEQDLPEPEYVRGVDSADQLRRLVAAGLLLRRASESAAVRPSEQLPKAAAALAQQVDRVVQELEQLERQLGVDRRVHALEQQWRPPLSNSPRTISEANQARIAIAGQQQDPDLQGEERFRRFAAVVAFHYGYRNQVIFAKASSLAKTRELQDVQELLLSYEDAERLGEPLVDWVVPRDCPGCAGRGEHLKPAGSKPDGGNVLGPGGTAGLTQDAQDLRQAISPAEAIRRLRDHFIPIAGERVLVRLEAADQLLLPPHPNPEAALEQLRPAQFAPFERLVSENLQADLNERRRQLEQAAGEQRRVGDLIRQADRIAIPAVDGFAAARSAWALVKQALDLTWYAPNRDEVRDKVRRSYAQQLSAQITGEARQIKEAAGESPEQAIRQADDTLDLLDGEARETLPDASAEAAMRRSLRAQIVEARAAAEQEQQRRQTFAAAIERARSILGAAHPGAEDIEEGAGLLDQASALAKEGDLARLGELRALLGRRSEATARLTSLRIAVRGGNWAEAARIEAAWPKPWPSEVEALIADAGDGARLQELRRRFDIERAAPSWDEREDVRRIAQRAGGRFQEDATRFLDALERYDEGSVLNGRTLLWLEMRIAGGWPADIADLGQLFEQLERAAGKPGRGSDDVNTAYAECSSRYEKRLKEEILRAASAPGKIYVADLLAKAFPSETHQRLLQTARFEYYRVEAHEAEQTAEADRSEAAWQVAHETWQKARDHAPETASAEFRAADQGLMRTLEGRRRAGLGTQIPAMLARPRGELTALAAELERERQVYPRSLWLHFFLGVIELGLTRFPQATLHADAAAPLPEAELLKEAIRQEQDRQTRQAQIQSLLQALQQQPAAEQARGAWTAYGHLVGAHLLHRFDLEKWWNDARTDAADKALAQARSRQSLGAAPSEVLPLLDTVAHLHDRTGEDPAGVGPERDRLRNDLESQARRWLGEAAMLRAEEMQQLTATFAGAAADGRDLAMQVRSFSKPLEEELLEETRDLDAIAKNLATLEATMKRAEALLAGAKRSGLFPQVHQALDAAPEHYRRLPYHKLYREFRDLLNQLEQRHTALTKLLAQVQEAWEQESFEELAQLTGEPLRRLVGRDRPMDEFGLLERWSAPDPALDTPVSVSFSRMLELLAPRAKRYADAKRWLDHWEARLPHNGMFQHIIKDLVDVGQLTKARDDCLATQEELRALADEAALATRTPAGSPAQSRKVQKIQGRLDAWLAHLGVAAADGPVANEDSRPPEGAASVTATLPWLERKIAEIDRLWDEYRRACDDVLHYYPLWQRASARGWLGQPNPLKEELRQATYEAVERGLRVAPKDVWLLGIRNQVAR